MGLGKTVFALSMIAFGIMGLIEADFTPIWLPVPDRLPGHGVLAWLCAVVSLSSGIGLLWRRAAAAASLLLCGRLTGWLVVFRVPDLLRAPTLLGAWSGGQTAVLLAGSLMLLGSAFRARGWPRFGGSASPIARGLYGAALLPLGLAHFVYLGETVVLVPGWLPRPVAWAYLTGGAFIAAGIAVLAGVWARLAAVLSTVQLALFTVLVWIPIVVVHTTPFQWGEFVVSWALTSAAWVVADSYRDSPWFAVRWRP